MKFKFFFFGLFFAFFLAGIFVDAQEAPVIITRSNDKVVIEGKVYYIHVVKKGETLFSISRAYNVSQKDILIENPSAHSGLQIDQSLKIPYSAESEQPLLDAGEYIIHRVEQGQTLFSLSQSYQVKIEEIVALNPGVDEVLRVGDNLRIPRRGFAPQKEGFPPDDDRFHYHKVEKGETLYSLSKRYNVSIRDIRRANRKLIWGLKAGEFISIPKIPDFYDEDEKTPDLIADTLQIEKPVFDSLGFYELAPDPKCLEFDYFKDGRTFHVALFLPLFLSRNFPQETISDETTASGRVVSLTDAEVFSQTLPYLEFYEGARIAIDSLRKAGLSVNLYVWDSERNGNKLREILNSWEFRDIDLIVGPFFPEEVAIVSNYARQNQIPIVTPVSTQKDFLLGNPYLYQVTPSVLAELEQSSLFLTDFPANNFVIIHKNDPDEIENVQRMKDYLFRHFSMKNEFNQVVIKEIIANDSLPVNIEQSLNRGNDNFVVMVSKNQAFITDIVNRLNILSNTYSISLFGMYDWQRYTNLDIEYFHNLTLHYSAPSYVDYSKPEVKKFLKEFRKLYKAEPSEYGFLGFDVFYYFLNALKSFGPDFTTCLPYMKIGLVHGDFMFRKMNEEGGFENHGLSIIRFNKDYSVVKLNGPVDIRKIARQNQEQN